jgi:hypothetical protein
VSEDTLRVEFAYPYTDKAGKNHNADASASLPREEAKNLIHFGRARAVKETAAVEATAKKEVK